MSDEAQKIAGKYVDLHWLKFDRSEEGFIFRDSMAKDIRAAIQQAETRMREPLPPEICKHDPPHPRACLIERPPVFSCDPLLDSAIDTHCRACRGIENARKEAMELACRAVSSAPFALTTHSADMCAAIHAAFEKKGRVK